MSNTVNAWMSLEVLPCFGWSTPNETAGGVIAMKMMKSRATISTLCEEFIIDSHVHPVTKPAKKALKKSYVWRVENEFGRGMYLGSGGFYSVSGNHQSLRQPAPKADEGLMRELREAGEQSVTPFVFGFATLEQFKLWVHHAKWRRALHENGFKLVKYETRTRFVGDSQAVFRRSTSKVVETRRVDYSDIKEPQT